MKIVAMIAATLLVATSVAMSKSWGALAAQDEAGHPESVLEQRMHAVEDSVHALRRSLKDPAKAADSLASIAKLQADAVAAKSELPRMLPHVPEAERPEFVKNFRREMVRMLEASLKLETAVLDGKQEPINAAFEALRSMEDPAHERFTEEEK